MNWDKKLAEVKAINIEDKIEATFGPNPCQQLHLQTDQGEHLYLTCDNKRCIHCGPRKKAIIQLQMEASFGEYAYITVYDNRLDLDRAISSTRKRAQRDNHKPLIQSVGDSTLGWIVVSDRPMRDNQRLTTLADWTRRILDTYHHSVQRIRRSYALGRVSLLTQRRRAKSGQTSSWYRRTVTTDLVTEAEGHLWMDMLAELEVRDALSQRRHSKTPY